jgi:hypothetical protein
VNASNDSLWVRVGHSMVSAQCPNCPRNRKSIRALAMSQKCRFCCKSLFVLAIEISFGGTGDFHVNMWGTSSSEEKLAGDPGNVIAATSIGGRRSDFFTAGKLAPGNFGLLQQYLPRAAVSNRSNAVPYSITSSARASSIGGTVRLRALAATRLIAKSKMAGCMTGKSAGLSPFRMRPAYAPSCR